MESLARISSMLETARDLTLEAAQAASASATGRRKDFVSKAATVRETRKLLNSRMDREVLDGLKRVIATMSRGIDCSEYFADVVKNVASPVLEIKKLVYLFLLRYAESEPDLALLSINAIQKALNDQNQLIRALAIRVMSGIRVPVISQIVALAIKKSVVDMSAYVRKAAALAIPKCYKLDPSTLPALTENLSMLLGDKSYYVVGAAVMAFLEVCPDRLDLVHKHYRSLCTKLIDMDEWSQLAVLRLLTIYSRKCFPLRARNKGTKGKKTIEQERTGEGAEGQGEEARIVDPDLVLFLDQLPLLLHSRNSAVIIAIARAFRHLAPPYYLPKVAGPLVSLLRASIDIQHMALVNIITIAMEHPNAFAPYSTHFLIQLSDPSHVWKLKLEALTLIFPYITPQYKSLVLSELEYFAKGGAGYDKELVKESVKAIGRCAQSSAEDAKMSNRCLRLLLRQIESRTSDPTLVAESLTVIRHIIQSNPSAHHNTVIKLAKALDFTTNPTARANIIWLVGEFAGHNDGDTIASDTLRILAKSFHKEADVVKQQIVLAAAKVYVYYLNKKNVEKPEKQQIPVGERQVEEDEEEEENTHPIPLLYSFILLLSRYDVSYDIRDRARLYKSLLAVPSSTQLASLLLLAPKPTPMALSPSVARVNFTLGSASLFLGPEENVRGYENLPEWVPEGYEPKKELRDTNAEKDIVGRSAPSMGSAAGATISLSSRAQASSSDTVAGIGKLPPTAAGLLRQNGETLDEWLASSDDEDERKEDDEEAEEGDEDEDEDEGEEEDDDDDEGEEEEEDEEEEEGEEDSGEDEEHVVQEEHEEGEEDERTAMLSMTKS